MSKHRYFIELIDKHNNKWYINSRDQQVPTTVLAKSFGNEALAITKYEKLRRTGKLKEHVNVIFKPVINLQGT